MGFLNGFFDKTNKDKTEDITGPSHIIGSLIDDISIELLKKHYKNIIK